MDDKRPWSWSEDDRLTLMVQGGGAQTYTLIAAEPKRVIAFERRLVAAQEITETLHAAYQAFREGRAEYGDAVRRLEKLTSEWTKATEKQFAVAIGICDFFKERGMREVFHPSTDANALSLICREAIDRLVESAGRALAPRPPTPPPVDPPAAGQPAGKPEPPDSGHGAAASERGGAEETAPAVATT